MTPDFEQIERMLEELVQDLGPSLSFEMREVVKEYLHHGEYGLALEGTAFDAAAVETPWNRDLFAAIARMMELDEKQLLADAIRQRRELAKD